MDSPHDGGRAPDADGLRDRLRPHLDAARAEAPRAALVDGVAAAEPIRALVRGQPPSFLAGLSPEDRFLVAEASPETAAAADPALLAPGYCAALSRLPADWWGTPGSARTPAARRLVALGAAALPCLAARVADGEPLEYHHGEARMHAREGEWTVGDLAAGFAALILDTEYDHRAPPAERRHAADELRRRIGGQAG
jgi:hypothetical protein